MVRESEDQRLEGEGNWVNQKREHPNLDTGVEFLWVKYINKDVFQELGVMQASWRDRVI